MIFFFFLIYRQISVTTKFLLGDLVAIQREQTEPKILALLKAVTTLHQKPSTFQPI